MKDKEYEEFKEWLVDFVDRYFPKGSRGRGEATLAVVTAYLEYFRPRMEAKSGKTTKPRK